MEGRRKLLAGLLLTLCLASVVLAMPETCWPSFSIHRCPQPLDWSQVPTIPTQGGQGFYLSDCSAPAIQQTHVRVCYDQVHLRIHWNNTDTNIQSPYRNCNDPLFNSDVVEVFIAPAPESGNPVNHYVELELSPNSVLFASNITNPNLICNGISGDYLPCNLFQYKAVRFDSDNYWLADLAIPWKVVSQNSNDMVKGIPNSWVINMFRIDTPLNGAKEFSCWSCDDSSPPCFHKPAYFGTMTLQD